MEKYHLQILNQNPNLSIEFDLSPSAPKFSSSNLSQNLLVFEDSEYQIRVFYDWDKTENVSLFINGDREGFVDEKGQVFFNRRDEPFRRDEPLLPYSRKPFLLFYDLVQISLEITDINGDITSLYSPYLICASENGHDSENIEKFLNSLLDYDDNVVCSWIFSNLSKNGALSSSLCKGGWGVNAYRSFYSYLQLIRDVVFCYKSNLNYFRSMGRHIIKSDKDLISYEKVRGVSRSSFSWLMQNTDQLLKVPEKSGVEFEGENYIPYLIESEVKKKTMDVYENVIVLGFLKSVLLNARGIYLELSSNLEKEKKDIEIILKNFEKNFNENSLLQYSIPIVTIKKISYKLCSEMSRELMSLIDVIEQIYPQYEKLFPIKAEPLHSFPRRTKFFQEIKPYVQVFEAIIKWFKYGEYSTVKEDLVLRIKTVDKLFEYYCLFKILDLLCSKGFTISNVKDSVSSFHYHTCDDYYENETDVNNTYVLEKERVKAVVYYQAVVHSQSAPENNLGLYRTTRGTRRTDYYTPDFIIKFINNESGQEEYVIFDSKFSSRRIIHDTRKESLDAPLNKIIKKYSTEIASEKDGTSPRMVWALQGRVGINDPPCWRRNNSEMSRLHRPRNSYGIFSINSIEDTNDCIWKELKNNIDWLR